MFQVDAKIHIGIINLEGILITSDYWPCRMWCIDGPTKCCCCALHFNTTNPQSVSRARSSKTLRLHRHRSRLSGCRSTWSSQQCQASTAASHTWGVCLDPTCLLMLPA